MAGCGNAVTACVYDNRRSLYQRQLSPGVISRACLNQTTLCLQTPIEVRPGAVHAEQTVAIRIVEVPIEAVASRQLLKLVPAHLLVDIDHRVQLIHHNWISPSPAAGHDERTSKVRAQKSNLLPDASPHSYHADYVNIAPTEVIK